MIKQYSYGDLTWIDLESPTHDEIKKLSLVYKLESVVEKELLTPSLKPKVGKYPGYLYVILHFPILHPRSMDPQREIDFVIGEKFIMTTHYNSIEHLHKFKNVLDSMAALGIKDKEIHAGHIFFKMIQQLYGTLLGELETLSMTLNKAEKNIFRGKEKGMLITLSKINRDLLDFKAATNLHKSILESYEKEANKFFGDEYDSFSKELLNEYYRIHTSIQESKDFLEELRRTNDSLLSNKQNEIMKTVTVLAFIFLPLSLFASIFGMNIDSMPVVGHPHSFELITGGMAFLAVAILLIARYKEWL